MARWNEGAKTGPDAMRGGRSSGDNDVELVAESSQARRSCGNTVEFAVEPAAVPPVIFAPDELEALRREPQTSDLQRKAREGSEYATGILMGTQHLLAT